MVGEQEEHRTPWDGRAEPLLPVGVEALVEKRAAAQDRAVAGAFRDDAEPAARRLDDGGASGGRGVSGDQKEL